MALTHLVSIKVEDYSGQSGTVTFHLDATLTVAQVQSVVDQAAADLDAVSGAKITGASVSLALTLPGGLKATATTNADFERGINWRADAADTDYSYTVRTPAALAANVNGEAVIEDTNSANWESFLLGGDTVNAPTDKYGNDLVAILSKRVSFHK